MGKVAVSMDLNRPMEIIKTWRLGFYIFLTIMSAFIIYKLPGLFYMSATNTHVVTNTPISIDGSSTSYPSHSLPSSETPLDVGESSYRNIRLYINPMAKFVKHYDYEVTNMQLILVWPPGFCTTQETCWPEVDMRKFYIHGLWPANYKGQNKEACDLIFDPILYPSKMATLGDEIIQQLHEKWPSYQKIRRSQTQYEESPLFWKHEYLRHGSCAEMPFVEYFNRVLDQGNLNFENLLLNAGMLADTSTIATYDMFSRAFTPVIGNKKFYLSCGTDEKRLIEVIFCMDKDARNFISCPDTVKKWGCKNDQIVTFHSKETFQIVTDEHGRTTRGTTPAE